MIEYVEATLKDIEEMQLLVEPEVKSGVILPRSNDEIATNIRSYVLAKRGSELLGFGALHFHTDKLGEIRSLIVSQSARGKSIGSHIVNELLETARKLQAQKVFSFICKSENFLCLKLPCCL